ncbi:DUF4231 domain-containing protein [Hyphomonas sp.]|uniref:DUF4231 domain-containing protein n=1 Tax=Hyphomonas sp. TaxID=87 RepID=UPI00391D6FF8
MQVANRDMFPTPEMRARFPAITALLTNAPVDEAFNRHEALSVRAKRAYHRLGLASVVFISGAAIYTIAETLLFRGAAPSWIAILVAIAAALGVSAQVYMLAARLRSTWLINRFACERLRSIKFQAYAHAAGASSAADLEARTAAFSSAELAKLAEEVNAGISMFENFVPEKLVADPGPPPKPGDPVLIAEATTAYRELRTLYQDRYALSELHRLRHNRRFFHSAADLIYFAGAVLVLLSLLSKVVPAMPISAWVDFLAISCFVASLSKLVLDNASLTEPSAARFVRYREDIARVTASMDTGAGLHAFVPAMERIALGELEQFCDAAKTINYRL